MSLRFEDFESGADCCEMTDVGILFQDAGHTGCTVYCCICPKECGLGLFWNRNDGTDTPHSTKTHSLTQTRYVVGIGRQGLLPHTLHPHTSGTRVFKTFADGVCLQARRHFKKKRKKEKRL